MNETLNFTPPSALPEHSAVQGGATNHLFVLQEECDLNAFAEWLASILTSADASKQACILSLEWSSPDRFVATLKRAVATFLAPQSEGSVPSAHSQGRELDRLRDLLKKGHDDMAFILSIPAYALQEHMLVCCGLLRALISESPTCWWVIVPPRSTLIFRETEAGSPLADLFKPVRVGPDSSLRDLFSAAADALMARLRHGLVPCI